MTDTPPPSFTLDELLAYLREEPEAPKDYKTTREWADYFGITRTQMQNILRDAFNAGVLLRDTARRERYDGLELPLTVYMFRLGQDE
jgi:hypothetical protein